MQLILSSVDHALVVAEMKIIIPGWLPIRVSPYNGVTFARQPDRITKEAEYDDEGNIIVEPEVAGELRYWVYSDEQLPVDGLITVQIIEGDMRY